MYAAAQHFVRFLSAIQSLMNDIERSRLTVGQAYCWGLEEASASIYPKAVSLLGMRKKPRRRLLHIILLGIHRPIVRLWAAAAVATNVAIRKVFGGAFKWEKHTRAFE